MGEARARAFRFHLNRNRDLVQYARPSGKETESVDLAGVDAPVLRKGGGHGERRVAAERADLEHALWSPEPDEKLEEPAGDRPRQHLCHAEDACRLRRQLGEQVLVRRGELLDVLFDARIDHVHAG